MSGMEARIIAAVKAEMDQKVPTTRTVQTRPPTKRTATHDPGGLIIAAADAQNRYIEFDDVMGIAPDWIWIQPNQNCQLFFSLASDPSGQMEWPAGLVAGVPLVITDENWIKMEIIPAVVPCTVLWLATSGIPRGAAPPPPVPGEESTGQWLNPE